MADYSKLIDAEIWAFIEKTNDSYPDDAVEASIAQQREYYNQMCAEFHVEYPQGVDAKDLEIGGVPVRDYSTSVMASDVTVIYAHGGGFVVGGLESHDSVCAELCSATGIKVRAIDYRLSPEHKYPAALDDCLAVFNETPGKIVLVGDSAGGNLCAAISHVTRDPRILGQVLIYPALGGDMTKGSYQEHKDAPMLTLQDIMFYEAVRLEEGAEKPTNDKGYAPLQDDHFKGLPPTVAVAAECDPLADDCAAYESALQADGSKALAFTESGLVHGYLRARHMSEKANVSFSRICVATKKLAEGEMPSFASLG